MINLGADVPIRPHVNDVRLTDKDWGTFSFALGLRAGDREILETLLLYYVGVNVYRFESVEPAKARKMLRSYAKKMSVLAQALRKNTRTQLRFAYGNHDFISRLIQIRKKMMKFSEELTVLAAAVPKLEAGRKGGWTRGAVDVLTAWHLLSLARGGPGVRVRKVAPAHADPTAAFMQFLRVAHRFLQKPAPDEKVSKYIRNHGAALASMQSSEAVNELKRHMHELRSFAGVYQFVG